MPTTIRPVRPEDIAEFLGWHYEPPYDVYDLDLSPAAAVGYFMDPAIHCHVILVDGVTTGYCTFGADARVPGGDYTAPALDIGMAIKPDATGRGLGRQFVADVVGFAVETFTPERLRVSIAGANPRAMRVWAANGFVETGRFATPREVLGSREFVMMERPARA
jgi:GNAT superfamily N-acetyltransferase